MANATDDKRPSSRSAHTMSCTHNYNFVMGVDVQIQLIYKLKFITGQNTYKVHLNMIL